MMKTPSPSPSVIKILFLQCLFCLFCACNVNAQFETNYSALAAGTEFPKDYAIDVLASSETYAASNSVLDKKVAKKYFNEVFYIKKQIFDAGEVYLPNALSLYVDSLASALLVSEPGLRSQIKIYLTRYNSTNAFCLADGSIFVNIGLLKVLDNESELAFVLAHEMGHYSLQHSIKDFSKTIAINEKENNTNNSFNSTFRKLRFSRESELEADGYALSLMNNAGFDIQASTTALEKLKDKLSSEDIDIEKTFNNSFFSLDTTLHSKDVLKKAKKDIISRIQNTADSKIDDLYETHPDLDKRIASIKELERNIRLNAKQRKPVNYSYYKTLVSFEICENNLRELDYMNAIINSLLLLNTYPKNNHLIGTIAKSLYWVSYYKELSKGDLILYGDLNQNTLNFYALYTLFDRISLKDTKALAYAYLRSKDETFNENEALDFYLALSTENYLGKVAAVDFYRSYQTKFPNGAYSSFVKNKLK